MLDSIPLDQKLRLLVSLSNQAKQAAVLGVEMYRPHAKQDMFHRLGKVKFRYARTGNRFGKSDMGSAEDVAWCLGYRPWYPENDPARFEGIPQRACKGIILCTDWSKAEEVFTSETEGATQGKLWKWIPKDSFVRRDTAHNGHICKITIKSIWGGESSLYLDTVAGFKLNDQRGESSWYDFIHVDEPIPEAMWKAYSRGLIDTNGKAWFTCTPLREPWINKFFLPTNRHKLDDANANFFGEHRVVLVGKSTDNPYVSKAGIAEYVAGLNERERGARLFGRPIDSSGMVHGSFEMEKHVYYDTPPGWRDVNTPPLDYTIRYHVDCHPVTPNAVLFSATSPSGQVFFFDEIFEACTADILAEMIVEKLRPYFVASEWMDPSGFVTTMTDKSCFADYMNQAGLAPEKASKDLKRGILETEVALKTPNYLYFAHNLTRTLYEFDNYVYDDPDRKPDQPRDKDDHMMEGLHRLVMGGLGYIDQMMYDEKPSSAPNYLLTL